MFATIQNIKSININQKGRKQKSNVNEETERGKKEKEMRSGREKKLKRYKEGRNRREIWGETEKSKITFLFVRMNVCGCVCQIFNANPMVSVFFTIFHFGTLRDWGKNTKLSVIDPPSFCEDVKKSFY